MCTLWRGPGRRSGHTEEDPVRADPGDSVVPSPGTRRKSEGPLSDPTPTPDDLRRRVKDGSQRDGPSFLSPG